MIVHVYLLRCIIFLLFLVSSKMNTAGVVMQLLEKGVIGPMFGTQVRFKNNKPRVKTYQVKTDTEKKFIPTKKKKRYIL